MEMLRTQAYIWKSQVIIMKIINTTLTLPFEITYSSTIVQYYYLITYFKNNTTRQSLFLYTAFFSKKRERERQEKEKSNNFLLFNIQSDYASFLLTTVNKISSLGRRPGLENFIWKSEYFGKLWVLLKGRFKNVYMFLIITVRSTVTFTQRLLHVSCM